MRTQLNFEEHQRIGITLQKLHAKCLGAAVEFCKTSNPAQKLRRAGDLIGRLISQLNDLLFGQFPDDASGFVYHNYFSHPDGYHGQPLLWGDVEPKMRMVGKTIHGKVPAKTLELFLKCEQSLGVAVNLPEIRELRGAA